MEVSNGRFLQVGVAQEQGGDNVIDFQSCDQGTQSFTFDNSSLLLDGHSYVTLLKVSFFIILFYFFFKMVLFRLLRLLCHKTKDERKSLHTMNNRFLHLTYLITFQ